MLVPGETAADGAPRHQGLHAERGGGCSANGVCSDLLKERVYQHLTRRRQYILTKGDNNELDDVALYPVGQDFVHREQVVGVVKGYLPYVGYITIALNESAWFRGVMIAILLSVGLLSS